MSYSFQDNGKSHLVLNPRLSDGECEQFSDWLKSFEGLPDHIWVQSSGSSSSSRVSSKLVALSKNAFRVSASASNRFLQVTKNDVWGLSLPDFHVGGLSIWARAELLGNQVVPLRDVVKGSFVNSAEDFVRRLALDRVSLLSLVPTQVFDLAKLQLKAPSCLRVVIVGGAALDPTLYQAARELGWPVLPSFGMTEACSQVATAPLKSLERVWDRMPDLVLLDHLRAEVDEDDHLVLEGESLMSGFCQFIEGVPSFTERVGAYTSPDRAELQVNDDGSLNLRPLGRVSEFVKILGEGVSLQSLRERFSKAFPSLLGEIALVAISNARQGAEIVMVTESQDLFLSEQVSEMVSSWNEKAFPPERIFRIGFLSEIPRTDLGKIQWSKLNVLLGKNVDWRGF